MNATTRELLVRERLLRSLDDESVGITLLQAPSGYGKTTLMRMWVDAGRHTGRLLWVTFGTSTTSRNSVWEQIARAALREGLVTSLQFDDLMNLINSDDFEKRDLMAAMRGEVPFTIVLDGYERLGELAPVIDQDLLRGVENVPGMRVIIAARGRTALDHLRLQLRGQVKVITNIDLEFTQAEVTEFFRLVVGDAQVATPREVYEATGGYAIAVRAAVLELSRSGPRAAHWRENALNTTNLSGQLPSKELAHFARITSVVPYFDASLARMLVPQLDPDAAISVLEADGFGRHITFTRTGGAFQYVTALREALHEELRTESPTEYKRAASIASAWLVANGDPEGALELALEVDDYELASRICSRLLLSVVEAYTTDRYEVRLQHLSNDVLVAYPILAFALGLARLANPVLRNAAKPLLQIAAGMRVPTDLPTERRGEHLCFKVFALRTLGRYRESAELAREALEVTKQQGPAGSSTLPPVFTRGVALSLFLVGDVKGAHDAVADTFGVPQSQSSRNLSFSDAAGYKAIDGDMPTSEAVLAQIDEGSWKTTSERGHLGTLGHIARSYVLLERGEWAQARSTLENVERHSVTSDLWPYLQEPVMLARLAQGEALAEARRVEEMLDGPLAASGAGESLGLFRVKAFLVVLWLAAGRPARARKLLEGYAADDLRTLPARALLALVDGDTDQSMRLVSRSLDFVTTPRMRTAVHALGAAGALRSGDREVALSMIGLASGLSRQYGLISPLLLLPDRDRRALAELSRESGGPDDVAMFDSLDVVTTIREVSLMPQFTERERVVVHALARHTSPARIAEELFVSPNTVKTQLRSAYKKLGVHSRPEALRRAESLGLLRDRSDD
ncbi:LuxR C-terminal-related transcriptional regulator [Pseudoclavibacter sp. AY1F1]|uniref:helix-turn-helix transcriptional regulator n=1 Tax=Pseudoclavibacter sp. AY1F1 TaxID=2080583 RepID=UPI0011B0A72C|nr:LuxR C-terminal-related transcriptional regulator [Pseudoclavibacter sp. AY1F1]